ncbi:MAG: ATP-binding protein [Povalibacter sp.]
MIKGRPSRQRDPFDAGQRAVLESIAVGAPLREVLEKIVELIEAQSADMLCTIVLVNADGRISHAAGGRVPSEFVRAIEGEQIGPEAGSCGTAAFTGQPVIVEDIETHPAWKSYRQLAAQHGLRACWSVPILGVDGTVLATFAMYYREVRRPSDSEREWVEVATHLVSVALLSDRARSSEIERRRMEEQVRVGEHLRSIILDSVADGIYYVGVEGEGCYRILSVNSAFTKLFGITAEEIVGHMVEELMPEEMRAQVLKRYAAAAMTGERQVWEEVMVGRAGRKYGEVTLTPLFDGKRRCINYVGTIHDITARIVGERERIQLQSKLHQAQRMQALGTLAGGIAHDFNNILAAIGGNTDLLLDDVPQDSPMRRPLLEIQKASRRANDLVRQILTFSRSAAPAYEVFDPRVVAQEALELLRATLRPNLQLRPRFADNTPFIKADSTQFHQILINLITNAAHACGEGGEIEVNLDCATEDDIARDTGTLVPAGTYLRLRVKDHGCGMDPATLKRVFEPFFTTRAPGEGTGLGLSVVHGIVESHHGAIHIDSAPALGTSVNVFLPASQASQTPAQSETPIAGNGEHVMYVDDEEALVLLMERALAKKGYVITGHSNPAAALKDFASRPEAFQVIITDLAMPGMSGPHLAEKLREIRPDVPIIMTSGYIRAEDRQAAQQLQINQLVYKSNTVDQLAEALASEIAGLKSKDT